MKSNAIIAIAIAVMLTLWLIFGSMLATTEDEPETAEKPIPTVRVRQSAAQSYSANVTLRGKTEPARSTTLKAEGYGQILEIPAQRGTRVSQGEVLIRIAAQDLPEQLAAAEKLRAQRELEHEAAEKLVRNGYQSETRLAESAALLADAERQFAAARIALEHTEIKAPFDGVFNERLVEVGDYVASGDPVAHFLQLDPMIVSAEATELQVRKLKPGQTAQAIIDGQSVEGSLRYISRAANSEVRTYTIELEFDNSKLDLRAGLTADIVAQTAQQKAHQVSPSLLFLSANADGDLGIKTVDEQGIVAFHHAEILGNAKQGVWIGGLPDNATIITVGQGFVKPGIQVNAVEESSIQ